MSVNIVNYINRTYDRDVQRYKLAERKPLHEALAEAAEKEADRKAASALYSWDMVIGKVEYAEATTKALDGNIGLSKPTIAEAQALDEYLSALTTAILLFHEYEIVEFDESAIVHYNILHGLIMYGVDELPCTEEMLDFSNRFWEYDYDESIETNTLLFLTVLLQNIEVHNF